MMQDLLRVVAPNPSPMTFHGTNAYVVGRADVAVIDPGPVDAGHLDALLRAIGGRPVRAVLVTHPHLDHSPLAAPLAARVGAPVMAFGRAEAGRSAAMENLVRRAGGGSGKGLGGGEGVDRGFAPDAEMADGDAVAGDGWTLVARWTPGHMGSHLSFGWPEARAVFTGDVAMGWASTMISPPDGDLGQFMATLDRLEAMDVDVFLPGHGEPVAAPAARCRALRAHRLTREAAILAALPDAPTIPDLVDRLYADVAPALHGAAARNVLAHLIHLEGTGHAAADPAPGPDARWSLR